MVLGRQVSTGGGDSYLQAVELTEDHKPDNPIECRRIHEAGGRVDRLVSGNPLMTRLLHLAPHLGLLRIVPAGPDLCDQHIC